MFGDFNFVFGFYMEGSATAPLGATFEVATASVPSYAWVLR